MRSIAAAAAAGSRRPRPQLPGPHDEARRLVVVRPVPFFGQPEVRMRAEAVDHGDDPVPAIAGLAVRQVVQVRA